MQHSSDDGSRRVKNIAAILYLIVMAFLVGGSYVHQHSSEKTVDPDLDLDKSVMKNGQ